VSMTGSGFVQIRKKEILIEVYGYSTNKGDLMVKIDMPPYIKGMEPQILSLVREKLVRGYVEISVRVKYEGVKEPDGALSFPAMVKRYEEVVREAGMEPYKSLHDILLFYIWMNWGGGKLMDKYATKLPYEEIMEKLSKEIQKGVIKCVDGIVKSRIKEGKNLEKAILKSIRTIDAYIARIEKEFDKEKEAVSRKGAEGGIYNSDEVASLLKRIDISEEIVRLKSHSAFLKGVIEGGDEPSRKGKFIVNEMLREASTISAKSIEYEIQRLSVEIRTELEKIKEQLNNVL